MTEEVPRILVRAVDLHGECPLAVYDGRRKFELGIDFSRPPDEIVVALTDLFQEAVDSHRWERRGSGAHEQADDPTSEGAAPHPDEGPL